MFTTSIKAMFLVYKSILQQSAHKTKIALLLSKLVYVGMSLLG